MNIYLAARYSRRLELGNYAALLESLGHEITARWLSGAHEDVPSSGDQHDGAVVVSRTPRSFVSHFSTCPEADRFSGKSRKTPQDALGGTNASRDNSFVNHDNPGAKNATLRTEQGDSYA